MRQMENKFIQSLNHIFFFNSILFSRTLLMGISVSSTQTHERLIQKRAIRKMKRYQQNDLIRQNSYSNAISAEDKNKQTPGPETNKLHEINNYENLEITLKTNPKKYGDYRKLNSPQDQLLGKKDRSSVERTSQVNRPLTTNYINLENNHVSGQSSMQDIELDLKKEVNQLQINPNNAKSFETINPNNQPMSTFHRNISSQNDSRPNEKNGHMMDKEIERRKIEQAKRYIQSSPYPNKVTLSNGVYQHKSNTKIDMILSGGNSSPQKVNKTVVQNQEIPEVSTIKLKTDEYWIDEENTLNKFYQPVGTLLKNKSGKLGSKSSFTVLKNKSAV